jgi:hypothetical protein
MAEITRIGKVLHVVKTTAEWKSETTVPAKGLLCVEIASSSRTLAKVGDGTNTYTTLPYLQDGSFAIGNYYTKTQTDSKISEAIAALGNVATVKGVKSAVSELPTSGNNAGDIWFVGTTDNFAEYIYTTESKWEYLGKVQTDVDLSGYVTTSALNERLETLEANSHTHANKAVLDATTASYTTEEQTKLKGIATGATKVTVDSALSASSTNPVQNKAVYTALGKKVDAVTGKGLSTNDYTTDEKTKLASLTNYDDTALSARVATIEGDYIKSADTLIIECTL